MDPIDGLSYIASTAAGLIYDQLGICFAKPRDPLRAWWIFRQTAPPKVHRAKQSKRSESTGTGAHPCDIASICSVQEGACHRFSEARNQIDGPPAVIASLTIRTTGPRTLYEYSYLARFAPALRIETDAPNKVARFLALILALDSQTHSHGPLHSFRQGSVICVICKG